MDSLALSLILTPHGRLVLAHDAGAMPPDSALAQRLRPAFERGSGHRLLMLGADEIGTALPPVFSYWREFGARYVTAVCTRPPDGEAAPRRVPVAAPAEEELERIAWAAPLTKRKPAARKILAGEDLAGIFGLDIEPERKRPPKEQPAAGRAGLQTRKPASRRAPSTGPRSVSGP